MYWYCPKCDNGINAPDLETLAFGTYACKSCGHEPGVTEQEGWAAVMAEITNLTERLDALAANVARWKDEGK